MHLLAVMSVAATVLLYRRGEYGYSILGISPAACVSGVLFMREESAVGSVAYGTIFFLLVTFVVCLVEKFFYEGKE